MKPLETIYWLRFATGIVAALVCVGYGLGTNTISNETFSINTFFNTTSLAVLVYLISYYLIKFRYQTQVQKPTKLLTAGIGIYFLTWLAFWVLLYTIIAGSPPV